MKLRQSKGFAVLAIVYFVALPISAMSNEPSLTGDFPFENITAIYSGPFTHPDRSDMLVVENVGGLGFLSHRGGAGSSVFRLALYSFDGSKFQRIWECGALSLEYSIPRPNQTTISSLTWCYGDFDGDGRYSILTCNVDRMEQYAFVDSIFGRSKKLWPEVIRTPDSIWIDQMIACDINADGKDEIVALNYPDNPDSCCYYHAAIYRIEGDKHAPKRLVEIWHNLEAVGSNGGVVPPDHFISKCRLDGVPGEVPVIMGAQSDMSPTNYKIITEKSDSDYEIKQPFPKPPQMPFPDLGRRGDKEHRPSLPKLFGPIGGVMFNDGKSILHYGYFADDNNPDSHQKMVDNQFSVFEDGHWRLLKKENSDIGGLLTRFTISPGKSGWLFIKDGKYIFYDKLPVIY